MAALILLLSHLVASLFNSKSRLEAENAALRQQFDCAAAQGARSGSVHQQRSAVLHPTVSLVSVGPQGDRDHLARDPGALASCRILPVLALEISELGRPTANQWGLAGLALIRLMSAENLLGGAPRIRGELLKLGYVVAQST